MLDIACPKCQSIYKTQHLPLICQICGYIISSKDVVEPRSLEVLKIGDVVQITNAEHVWYGEFAVIRDIKPQFCKIEIFGKKTWIPQHWVQINEPDNTD